MGICRAMSWRWTVSVGFAVVLVSLVIGISPRASATTLTPVVGADPTGIVMAGAWAETPIGEFLHARAGLSVSVVRSARLLLAGGGITASMLWGGLEPMVGIGIGAALAPAGFASGAVLEGDVGARLWIVDWMAVLAQMRYIIRFSEGGVSAGPLFEAGLAFTF